MTPEQETLARQYAADESVVSTDRALLRAMLLALDGARADRDMFAEKVGDYDAALAERDAARKAALEEAQAVCLAQAVSGGPGNAWCLDCAEAIGELIPYEEAEK